MQINLYRLEAAIKQLAKARNAVQMQEKQLAQLDPHKNRDVIHENPKILEERRNRVKTETSAFLKECFNRFNDTIKEFHAYVAEATTPSGANLRSEDVRGDLYLLDHDLIDTPAELEQMRKRHQTHFNPTIMRAAARYAAHASRKWSGFEFYIDVEGMYAACNKLEKLAADFFENPESTNIDEALQNASGAQFLQYAKGA